MRAVLKLACTLLAAACLAHTAAALTPLPAWRGYANRLVAALSADPLVSVRVAEVGNDKYISIKCKRQDKATALAALLFPALDAVKGELGSAKIRLAIVYADMLFSGPPRTPVNSANVAVSYLRGALLKNKYFTRYVDNSKQPAGLDYRFLVFRPSVVQYQGPESVGELQGAVSVTAQDLFAQVFGLGLYASYRIKATSESCGSNYRCL